MVRVRNLVLAIAAATALTTEMAHALGLGEVTLKSSLNQPLVAEIELLDAKSLAPGEVVPALASVEDFSKAGVDRLYFLTDLKFTPVLRPDGKSVIQVTSSKPVREPYLNFLVEVMWPNGRLLREYTLLLDPPLYSPETAAAAAPQLPIAPAAPRQAPAAQPAQRPAATAGGAASGSTAASTTAGGEYRTSARDTLWEIAERNRQGGSVHQAMLAIQDLNPNAFIDGNINRMLSGQVLRMPTAEQVRQRSQAEAIAEVAQQNAAWRQGTGAVAGARQIDATQRNAAGASPSRSEAGDSLRLVAPNDGNAESGSDRGAEGSTKALSDKLAVTQESLDSSRRENAELRDRMQDLQGQLEKLQRLMALKDDQLARLQAQLGADAAGSDAADDQDAAPATGAEAPESGLGEPARAGNGDASQPAATDAPVTGNAGQAGNATAPAPSSTASQPTPSAQTPAPAAQAPRPATQPATPAASEREDEGFVGSLLANPVMLGLVGGGVLLLLLVGLMALSRRNAMKEAELQESLDNEEHFNGYGVGTAATAPAYTHSLADEEREEALEQPVTAQSNDPLAEADIYIAYGRFNQAAELLQNALNNEPQRTDLRLKLMEVYAELGDREGFARQEAELREIGGAGAGVDGLKAKFPAMAAATAGGVAAAAAAPRLDDLSLDDLDLGDDEPVQPPVTQGAEGAFDLDLDLDSLGFGMDEEPRPAAEADGAAESIADATADGMDEFSFDEPLALDTPAAEAPADSDFDFNLMDEPASATPAEVDPLADFDFQFDEPMPSAEEPTVAESETPAGNASDLDDFGFELPEEQAQTADSSLPDDFDLSLDEPLAEPAQPEAPSVPQASEEALASPQPIGGGAGDSLDDDFDFLADADETATKLDLAKAYIDMGDSEGARDILDEVMSEGSDSQQQEAREMLARLG